MGAWHTFRSWTRLFTRAPARNVQTWQALRPWFESPLRIVAQGRYRGPVRLCASRMRDGPVLTYRAGTSDLHTLHELFVQDSYRLGQLPPHKIPWIVDVGGHIGLFSFRAAPLAEHVLAFEPVPENFALLEKNLAGPSFAHVERMNVAVSDRMGTLRLYLGGKNTGGHSSWPAHVPEPGGHVDVPCVSLADVLTARGIERVGLLKLDCEGAEYGIVEDLERFGFDRIDRIAMEYHRAPAPGAPSHSGEGLEARLRAAGFRVERVPGKRGGTGLLFATRVG